MFNRKDLKGKHFWNINLLYVQYKCFNFKIQPIIRVRPHREMCLASRVVSLCCVETGLCKYNNYQWLCLWPGSLFCIFYASIMSLFSSILCPRAFLPHFLYLPLPPPYNSCPPPNLEEWVAVALYSPFPGEGVLECSLSHSFSAQCSYSH